MSEVEKGRLVLTVEDGDSIYLNDLVTVKFLRLLKRGHIVNTIVVEAPKEVKIYHDRARARASQRGIRDTGE